MEKEKIKELIDLILYKEKENEFQEIIEILNDELLKEAKSSILWLKKAIAYFKNGQIEKADELVNISIELNNQNAEAFFFKGKIYEQDEKWQQAKDNYLNCLDIDPKYLDALIALADHYRNFNQPEKAMVYIESALLKEPDDPEANAIKGHLLLLDNKVKEAEKSFKRAIKTSPSNSSAYLGRGMIQERIGKIAEAVDYYIIANSAIMQSAAPYFQLAGIYKRHNDKDKYFENYRIALRYLTYDYKSRLNYNKLAQDDKLYHEFEKDTYEEEGPMKEFLKYAFELSKIVLHIKETSLFHKSNEEDDVATKTIVHYTKLETVDNLFKKGNGKFRYYNMFHMSDSAEGEILYDLFDENVSKYLKQLSESLPGYRHVYFGSFIPLEKSGDYSTYDDLLLWRTYGKNLSGKEGAGCCIEISYEFFSDKKTIKPNKLSRGECREQLFKVFYVGNKNVLNIVDESNVNQIEGLIGVFNLIILDYLELLKKATISEGVRKKVEKFIFRSFLEIRYLFKSSQYSFEREYRVIIKTTSGDNKIRIDNSTWPRKLFYNSANTIAPHIRTIVLGPNAQDEGNWTFLNVAAMRFHNNPAVNIVKSKTRYK